METVQGFWGFEPFFLILNKKKSIVDNKCTM